MISLSMLVSIFIKKVKISEFDSLQSIKKAKKQEVDEETMNLLKNSIIRSLSREAEQFYQSQNENVLLYEKKLSSQLERALKSKKIEMKDFQEEVIEICGRDME